MALKLLFITPRIDESHDDLAFASLWAKAFADAGYDVRVICGIQGEHTLPFPVYAVGRKQGEDRLQSFLRFQKLIMGLKYDRVFVHLGQRWLGAGAWWWWIRGIPTYLWYTHYTNPLSLKIGAKMVKRMFAATEQSLPHYADNDKKVVTGHGIDLSFWEDAIRNDQEREPPEHLLAVHRISRSKRIHLAIQALALLPASYTLTHYGRRQDPNNADEAAYFEELLALIKKHGLENRVAFKGSIPMSELRKIYPKYRTFINLVPKTIDKTVLEAMYCGLTPIIIKEHADAIGYPHAPEDETPEKIAEFILSMKPMSADRLREIVETRHSLKRLIEKMSVYIRPGN